MKNGIVTVLAGAVMAVLATTVSAAEPTQVERVQAAIDAWLAARAPIKKVTGIAAVAADFLLNLIAYNLIRIPKLVAA